MDSEHELAEDVNCYDEANDNCEMEESSELTEIGTTDDMTVPATTCYEKDVDIEVDIEEKVVKLKRKWKIEMRKMLAVVLETLKHNKSLFDKAESITWNMSTLPDQIGILEKYVLKETLEIWEKIWTLVDSKPKWEDYYKLLRECWEDFEEEDFKIIDECKGLGAEMETQRTRMLKTIEEYFRKAGIIV